MLNFTSYSERLQWVSKAVAVVCLIALLAMAGVQAMHMHADTAAARNGSLDSHCSLCMVSHCVVRPQQAYVLALPARVLLHTAALYASQTSQARIFDRFVRPPPAV